MNKDIMFYSFNSFDGKFDFNKKIESKDLAYLFNNNNIEYSTNKEINEWFDKAKKYTDHLDKQKKDFENLVINATEIIKHYRHMN